MPNRDDGGNGERTDASLIAHKSTHPQLFSKVMVSIQGQAVYGLTSVLWSGLFVVSACCVWSDPPIHSSYIAKYQSVLLETEV